MLKLSVAAFRFFCLFILLSLSVHAQQQHGFLIAHLKGDFYVYTTWQDIDAKPFPANGMYVVTAKGILIIDSPWDTTQAIPLLDSIEKLHHKKVIAAIATHCHNDRTGSFNIFEQRVVKTYSTCQTVRLCKEKNEPQAEYCFAADTVFEFGDHSLQTFYPGKGHAPDNIVLWFADEKILYGGCFIKSCEANSLGYLGDADIDLWAEALTKVKHRFPGHKYIITGHQKWASNKSLAHTIELIKEFKKAKK